MAQINIRMEDELKRKAEALFEELGLTMSTAVTMFVRQAIREGGIHFEVNAGNDLHSVEPPFTVRSMEELYQKLEEGERAIAEGRTVDGPTAMAQLRESIIGYGK